MKLAAFFKPPKDMPIPRRLLIHAAFASAYFVVCLLSYRVGPHRLLVASIWPAAGFALALLLAVGPAWWPGIVAGSLAAHLVHGAPLAVAAGIAAANGLSAAGAAAWLRRRDFQPGLHRVEDSLRLVLYGALVGPLLSSAGGFLAWRWLSLDATAPTLWAWASWWSGDALGVLLVTPVLLTWFSRATVDLKRPGQIEGWILIMAVVAASVFLMAAPVSYEYAVFILIAWTALRFGPRGSSAAVAVLSFGTVWHAAYGAGPFAVDAHGQTFWRLQLFLALLSTASVVLTAMAMGYAQIEGALRASQERFRRIFERAGVGISVVQLDGQISDANPAFAEMLGYSAQELASRSVADITEEEDMELERPLLVDLLAGARSGYQLVKRYRRKDGSTFPGRLTVTRISNDGREPAYTIGVTEDISRQQAAEEALHLDILRRKQSELRLQQTTRTLQTLIDAAPLPIYAIDPRGRVRTWNAAAERVFGWSADEVVGEPLPIVQAEAVEEFRAILQRVFAGELLSGKEVLRRRRDGVMLNLRVNAAATRGPDGATDGLIAITEDVTERLSLSEQLRQAQKMEAIGQLAGGIAHDFNNLLTIILTNAELLAGDASAELGERRAEWTELRGAALRGAEMVRKLMAFSRRRSLEVRPVNLVEVICGMERALRRLLPDSVEVTTLLDATGPMTIEGDEGAIEQILLNLATNARDSMPGGGSITLGISRTTFDEEHRRRRGWGTPGEYVLLELRDTGCGMSPEVKARAFEPFFTTKGMEKGTGLGMAMVYGLVKQQRGFIDLDSAPGLGTAVRMYFPAVAAPAIPEQARPGPTISPAGGSERILVVDDEEGVRRVTLRVLTRFGYHVEEAVDGEDALARIGAATEPFDLVLTDLAMPRMNGLRLFEELRRRGAWPPVLLMSGYAPEETAAMKDAGAELMVLTKPWSTPDLLRRVREALDGAPVAS